MCKKFFAGIIKSSFIIVLLYPISIQNHSGLINAQDSTIISAEDSGLAQNADTSGGDSLNPTGQAVQIPEVPDSVIYKKTDFTAEELIRGERLFYGLAYLGDRSVNCASCHNTAVSDTLNWNPDALEISRKYYNKSAEELSRALLRPLGKKMQEVHKDFQLSAEDITLMKAFMNRFVNIGLKEHKPVITNLLLLVIAFILFSLSVTDLIIKKIFKKRSLNLLIITVTGVFITWILAVNAIAFGRATNFEPDQPIKFSHAVHAGQNQIDCNYCHYSAKISKTAGIPAGSICNNCHFLVRNGTRSGTSEIAKIIAALDTNKAVPWVRIYKLPDYAFFSHAQHVTAGKIACESCHGDVKKVDRLAQVADLSMGWCIDCHKTRKVNLDNEYYKKYYPEHVSMFKEGKVDSVMIADIGGRDCGKCHY